MKVRIEHSSGQAKIQKVRGREFKIRRVAAKQRLREREVRLPKSLES